MCGCKQLALLSSHEDQRYKNAQERWKHGRGIKASAKWSLYTVAPLLHEKPWVVSALHHKSRFLHSSIGFANLTLIDICLVRRSFHSAVICYKEETVVEKSLKNLKNTSPLPSAVKEAVKPVLPVVKPGRLKVMVIKMSEKWQKFVAFYKEHGIKGILKHMWEEMKFYKDGFKLFWKDLRICIPLSYKYLTQGRSSLTRREYRLLKQTLIDLLLMIPIIPTLIIPFMEILIPVFLWIGMVPQVFMSKEAKEGKFRARLQRRIESAKLLVDSLNNMPLKAKSKKDGQTSTIQEFMAFMEKVKSSEIIPSTEEIMKFSRLFENSVTLDDLDVKQLQSLCKILGIGFLSDIPSSRVLRFQIETRMRELMVDDKYIVRDGLDNMTIEELQAANRARGMRALGLSEDRLKIQLEHWLELHLKEKVPATLLLLSRVMYLDENLSPAEQLKQTIGSLPEKTVDKVLVTSAETSGEKIDKKTKIKILEEEREAIKKERQQVAEEERLAQEKIMAQLLMEKEQKELSMQQLEQEKKRRLAEFTLQKMDDQRIAAEVAMKLQAQQEARQAHKVEEAKVVTPKVAEPVLSKEEIKPIVDKAEPVEAKPAEVIVDKAEKIKEVPVDEDITAQDLGDIERAIEDQARHYEDEMEEVKEDLDEYKEDVKDIKAIVQNTNIEKEIEETLNAKILLKRMDRLVKKFDKTIGKLQDERVHLKENISRDEVELKYDMDGKREELLKDISTKKKNLISANDILMSLKRLQKVPDDVRMQKVLEVLDTDKDGLIDINHVLKVTESLGRENLKLSKAQVSAMMNLVQKEAEIEMAEKLKEKGEKGKTENGKQAEKEPIVEKQAVGN